MENSREITFAEVEGELYKKLNIEIMCMCCSEEATISEDTPEELYNSVQSDGWKYLKSDELMAEGWWCGCDYLEDLKEIKND